MNKIITIIAAVVFSLMPVMSFAAVVTPTPPVLFPGCAQAVGDVNGDGFVDSTDVGYVVTARDQFNMFGTYDIKADIFPLGAPDGVINNDDINEVFSAGYMRPVCTPAANIIISNDFIGHEVGAGGILPPGYTSCNPFATTCYEQLEEGAYLIFPNPSYNGGIN